MDITRRGAVAVLSRVEVRRATRGERGDQPVPSIEPAVDAIEPPQRMEHRLEVPVEEVTITHPTQPLQHLP